MSEQSTCVARCGRRTTGYLCTTHQDQLRATLRDLPAMLVDLDVTVTKQARGGGNAKRAKGAEHALPFSWDAAGDVETIILTVTSWAQELYSVTKDDSDNGRPPGGVAALCGWLAGMVQFVARWNDEDAERFADEILSLPKVYRLAVDRRPDKVFEGPCRADTITMDLVGNTLVAREVECDLDLYADPNAATVKCDGWRQATTGCGHVHDVKERREWLLAQLEDKLVTVPDLLAALPRLMPEHPVNQQTVNSWIRRKRITPHGSVNGQPVFNGSELLALIRDDEPRRGPKRKVA